VVDSLMMTVVGEMEWQAPEVSIPAFLTIMTIPLTHRERAGVRVHRIHADEDLAEDSPR